MSDLERNRRREEEDWLYSQKLPSNAVDPKLSRHCISVRPFLGLLLLFPWEMWGRVGEKSSFKKQFKILWLFPETCHRVDALCVRSLGLYPMQMINPSWDQAFQHPLPREGYRLASQIAVYLKTYCVQHWVIYCLLTSNHINSKCVLVGDVKSLALCFFPG